MTCLQHLWVLSNCHERWNFSAWAIWTLNHLTKVFSHICRMCTICWTSAWHYYYYLWYERINRMGAPSSFHWNLNLSCCFSSLNSVFEWIFPLNGASNPFVISGIKGSTAALCLSLDVQCNTRFIWFDSFLNKYLNFKCFRTGEYKSHHLKV